MAITHLNPEGLHKNPAFSQGVMAEGVKKLIVVGGQNGIGPDGKVVADDLGAQTEQALKNVLAVLKAAGASQEHVIKLTIAMVQGQDVNAGFAASQKVWGKHATAITVLIVSGLGPPGALVEIEALAALT
jgi:enamine deaminase RidA (YjgF/YER057c/UK114 family)